MKKILSLLALLMLCVVGANAWTVNYALAEGDTFTSGQTVEVKNGDAVVATITYGESGGADFKAAKTNGSVSGYTAFTEGNGTNGNSEGGTFYTITPKVDATISVAVVLNADKAFFIEEDGTALEDYNGITEASKYYGTYEFTATADKAYKFYCAGSKLGFYGFKMTASFSKTIGFVPGVWAVDDATFAAYAWNDEGYAWFPFVEVSGAYGTQIPDTYTSIILTRINPSGTDPEPWNNVWNQTDDIDFTVIADQTVFTITGWGEGGGNSTYTTSNTLAEAKDKLAKAIALAEMLNSADLADAIAAAKQAQNSTDVTVVAAALQTLFNAVKPDVTTMLGELGTMANRYGYSELTAKIAALTQALQAENPDIDAITTQLTDLIAEGKSVASDVLDKVAGYTSVMGNETLDAAIAAATAIVTSPTSTVGEIVAALKSAVDAFTTAANEFVQTVAAESVPDETVQAKLAAIAALGDNPSLAAYGEAIRQLIAAYQAYQLEQIPVYTVAGTTDLTGYEWDNTKNEMTLNEGTGIYEWTAKFITVTNSQKPEFKVVKNANWETAWPDNNWVITPESLDGEGVYTITITFDPAAEDKIAVTGVKREAPVFADNNVYFWQSPDGYQDQNGGVAVHNKYTERDRVNFEQLGYYTISLNGKNDYSTDIVTITLDEGNTLEAGDQIAITAFRNKDQAGKKSGARLKFDSGSKIDTGNGTEFVNLNEDVAGADEYGTEPNTVTITAPAAAEGSTTIQLTRSQTGTNLFITKIDITRPVIEPAFADGTYYVMNANTGLLADANGLDKVGAALTFTFDETSRTYTVTGSDLFAGKQWTAKGDGYFTFSTVIDGVKKFAAVNGENFALIEDGTADAATWTLLTQDYWENEALSYNVAGTADLCGAEWDTTKNPMTKNAESGLYEWTAENITVSNDTKPEFKIVVNNVADPEAVETAGWYPTGDNWIITPDVTGGEGVFNITITFNAATKEIGVTAENAGEQPVLNTYSGIFKTNAGWEKVYAYAWSGSKEENNLVEFLGEWPGTEISYNERYGQYEYSFEAETAPEFIIFNNGLADDALQQTEDLAFENQKIYEYTIQPQPVLNTYTATFTTDYGWEKVYAYTWTDGEPKVEQLGAWPGIELTANEGVYTVTIEAEAAPQFIIFNDGDSNQTADLAFEDGKAYEYNKPNYYAFNGTAYIIDAESGLMMAAGHDYGTRGIVNELGLDLIFTANEATGKVTIDSRVQRDASNHFLGSNLYMDSQAYEWGLLYQDFGFYIVNADGKYINIDSNNNLALSDTPREWIIVTSEGVLEQRLGELAEATADSPKDATWLISGPDFNRADQRNNDWQVSADCTNKNLNGGAQTNMCAESYHSVFTIDQVLANAPAGVYALTAQGFYRQDGTDEYNKPYFFANDERGYFPLMANGEDNMSDASASFTAGKYTIEPVFVEVTEAGALTVGAKLETNTTLWCIWDNFQLKYYGTEANVDQLKNAELLKEMQELVAEATALKDKVTDETALAGLDAAIAQAGTATGTEGIQAAIDALKAAIAAAEKSRFFVYNGTAYVISVDEEGLMMAAGHDWGTRGIVNELGLDLTFTANEETNKVTIDSRVSNGGNNHFLGSNLYMDSTPYEWGLEEQEFGFYISDAEGKYISIDAQNNLVMSDTPHTWLIVTADGVKEERMSELALATKDAPKDATFLLQNPNFNRNDQRVSAWTIDPSDANHNFNGGNSLNNCGESYHAAATIKQTVSGAPAGFYELTAQGFYRQDNNAEEDAPVFYANGVNGDVPAMGTLPDHSGNNQEGMDDASVEFTNGKYAIDPIPFEVTEDGMIYVGVAISGTNQWVIWDNFQLKYYGTEKPVVEYATGDANLDGKVTTSDAVLAVSFALEEETPTEEQFKAADVNESNDITVTDAVAIVTIALEINNEPAPEAGARMDYGVNYLTMNGQTVSLTNSIPFAGFQMDVTLADGAMLNGVQLTERAAGMTMSYNRISDNTWRIIALSLQGNTISGNDGALFKLDITGNSTIEVTNIEFADAAARAHALGFGGEATGISLTGFDTADADIYNVNGVRTNSVNKGMNILRNAKGEVKKVFVK